MGPHDWRPIDAEAGHRTWRCQRCGQTAQVWPGASADARPDADGCPAPVDVPLPWGGAGPAGRGGSGAAA